MMPLASFPFGGTLNKTGPTPGLYKGMVSLVAIYGVVATICCLIFADAKAVAVSAAITVPFLVGAVFVVRSNRGRNRSPGQ